ncbi:hypothetical protein [Exercitatus varius]|uniref:hypothetical protein n=1 Tax=Exercitatus varius TaxID=67857 RepID=UPI0018A3E3B3|nr:hypothetical protein [Exercitatus varius]MDG2944688.1 hypothetical protein [Exercitatus varius]QOF67664.1 hypothetical protein IFE17_11180 [Actinobacillus sp. GY-402]
MWKVYKNSNEDLNFALGCLYCQCISLSEFKLWIEKVIRDTNSDNIPNYLFDLLDFNEPLFHMSNVIGFTVKNNLSEEDKLALYGIAYLRGVKIYDPPVTRNIALNYLENKPEISNKFNRFFKDIV